MHVGTGCMARRVHASMIRANCSARSRSANRSHHAPASSSPPLVPGELATTGGLDSLERGKERGIHPKDAIQNLAVPPLDRVIPKSRWGHNSPFRGRPRPSPIDRAFGPGHAPAMPNPTDPAAPGNSPGITALGLSELIPSARGRRPTQVAMEYVRDLTEADLPALLNPPTLGSKPQPLARIRARHHLLAQLLCRGVSHTEAGLITGYGNSTVSILLTDPAFKELMAHYSSIKDMVFLDVQERLAQLGGAAIEEIQHRLDEEPEKIGIAELRKIMEAALDRSGKVTVPVGAAGPTRPVNVTVKFVAPPGGEVEIAPDPNAQVLDLDPE